MSLVSLTYNKEIALFYKVLSKNGCLTLQQHGNLEESRSGGAKGATIFLNTRNVLGRTLSAGTVFNIAYLMYAVLVPLDAVHRGLPLWEVGVLTATPGVLQLPARILSGPLTSVWGEPKMLRGTFMATLVAGLLAVVIRSPFLGLAMGQLAIGSARGLYWTAAQSLVGRQPGERAKAMGLFTTFTKGGALIGILSSGFLAETIGTNPAFLVSSGLGALALILTWPLTTTVLSHPIKMRTALAGLWPAARKPLVLLYGSVAFLCAMPQALAQSFYPVYLLHLHASRGLAGTITALMSLGMTAAGLAGALMMRRWGVRRVVMSSSALLVLGFGLTPVHQLWLVGLGIFAAGWAAGWLNVAFLTRVADRSTNQNRGTHLAMTQVYFVVAMMITPMLSAWSVTWGGFLAGFGVPALVALLLALAYVVLSPRAEQGEVESSRLHATQPS